MDDKNRKYVEDRRRQFAEMASSGKAKADIMEEMGLSEDGYGFYLNVTEEEVERLHHERLVKQVM